MFVHVNQELVQHQFLILMGTMSLLYRKDLQVTIGVLTSSVSKDSVFLD